MSRCSICHTLIEAASEQVDCSTCKQEYHRSCWDELGGCATYGCAEAAPPEKPAPAPVVGGGWGDEKECPKCRRAIRASLLVCQCGARFPYPDPMTHDEYRDWVREQEGVRRTRRFILLLFIFSLAALPAPLLGPIAGTIAYRNRAKLAGADGTYLAMGIGSAALGAIYGLVLLLLLAGL
ncbi:MAG: RING finger protein [Planctomycetota bacterium]